VNDQSLVTGQKVEPGKAELAKQLRRQQTPEERLVWQRLKANGLGGFHFRRQQVIAGYIVDFYCHAVGLVVEVDGPIHEAQREEDSYRDEVLRSRGLSILRITNDEVSADIDRVLRRILATIESPFPLEPALSAVEGEGVRG